jgi:hypothetical protein
MPQHRRRVNARWRAGRLAAVPNGQEDVMTSITTAEMVWFPGLDHGGSTDVGPTNRRGKPDIVAPAIRSFFAQP